MKKIDLTGRRFGSWTVINQSEKTNKTGAIYWDCICDCGNKGTIRGSSLTCGDSTSCGCYNIKRTKECNTGKPHKYKDLLFQKFGLLTVIKEAGSNNSGKKLWLCECECGNTKIVSGRDLLDGHVKSCGCLKSMREVEIKRLLDNLHVDYSREHERYGLLSNNNHPLRFDFAIYKQNKIVAFVEHHGEQHYFEHGYFGKLQREETDQKKEQYCIDHNIPLFIIKYDEDIISAVKNILQQLNYFQEENNGNCN